MPLPRPFSASPWLAPLLFGGGLLLPAAAAADEPLSYNRDVRPILSDKCFFCHGPDPEHREAGLRLDVEEEAKAYAIDTDDPEASALLERIVTDDADWQMPPPESGKSLTSAEQATLRRWVTEGAPYEPYWAYAKPVRHAVPAVENEGWSDDSIDRFLLARMEEEGLEPSPEADAVTLIRRLSFDLTGLPPRPEAVQAFATDPSPDAYEAVVDQLLASEAFGERMAMYWLDLVRFADTVGYHGDQDQSISPYRDYVIDAFNRNLSFEQFTIDQLAGDLLPDPTIDQRIATGYNRLLQTSHEGGVQPKEYLAIYGADRVRNLSGVWMAATVGCAQCHDHKFDPYTIKDFTAMKAFFADVDEAQHFTKGTNSLPTARPPEIEVLGPQQRSVLQQKQQRLEQLQAERATATAATQADLDAQLATLQQEIEALEASKRKTMVTVSIEPRTTRLLPRGNWLDDSGPVIEPAIPEFMGKLDPRDADGNPRRANRLDLARWLTDPAEGVGGLTARVFVNRLWYLMFGTGISNSLADFGGQGQPPFHPELLDNLAIDFLESDWDIKRMVKRLVMTQAYRQSSLASPAQRDLDPYNQLFARQSRYRLPAEMVRDNALAVSGLLVQKIGGPSVKPYQPVGYYQHLNFPTRKYQADTDPGQWRRGVYIHWQRQFLHPMLKAMDAPSREECTAQRPRSNTPLEALVLLNDPTFVEAARAFAGRILRSAANDDEARLRYAFRQAVSRPPDASEQTRLLALLEEERARYAEDAKAAESLLRNNGLAAVEVPGSIEPAEQAAWTSVARVLLNLNETVTRN